MATAAIFMVGQRDLKRMLVYSSIEHGNRDIRFGNGTQLFGTFYIYINGLTKGVLFLG